MERIPFRKEELEPKTTAQTGGRRFMPPLNTPIKPRDNYLAFLRGEEPLWMPLMGDMMTMTPRIVADNISRGFVFDDSGFDANKEAGGPDMFGV